MKKIIILFLLLISTAAQAGSRIESLSRAGEKPFRPPVLKSVTLSNGMVCYLIEDHTLPIVRGMAIIRGGSVFDGEKKTGLGSVMAALLKEGGTAKRSPDQLRDFLDENAIGVSFSSSMESFEGYFDSLSKDSATATELFFEMLFEPAFDEDVLSVVKKRFVDGIKRENDVPSPVSARVFRELVYGAKDPWGTSPKISQVRRFTRKDVENLYSKFVSPEKIVLAMAGDFNRKEMLQKLEELAKIYPKRSAGSFEIPKVGAEDFAETKVVKMNFTQSAINIGHIGLSRDNEDKYAVTVLNNILGGGNFLANRLHKAVREKGGLAYETWSSFSFGPPSAPGTFRVHAKTRNETSGKAVELIKSEIQKIVDNGVTPDEFKKAKEGILNSLIFEYESPYGIVTEVARYVYFGYPEDYLEIFRKKIAAVSLDDVNTAAKKYLHPDKLKIVVVGQYERDKNHN